MDQPTLTPAVDQPSVRLRSNPRPVEVQAARKAVGRAGSWRRRIFNLVASHYGITSKEIARLLGGQTPCADCGCEHRPPIPVNQIATRLGELRDWGYITTIGDRGGAEIYVLTYQGEVERSR